MARFIGLHCEMCEKNFRIVHGPKKSDAMAGLSNDTLAIKEFGGE